MLQIREDSEYKPYPAIQLYPKSEKQSNGGAESSSPCANDCGRCDRDCVCYYYNNYAIATPPAGICYRGFMGQFEHFFPIKNLADAGKDSFNYDLPQSDRMRPYQLDNPIQEGLRGGYLSDDVTVNLLANASGIFATLECSWIPSYNNFTLQWFYQDLLEEFIPMFGEKYNVRPHWDKMLFNDGTYASNIYPKINSWLDIQEQMDPHCQFVNDFLAESLGTERCMSLFQ